MAWDNVDWSNLKPAPGSLALVQDFVNTRNYFRGGDLLRDTEEATARLAERGLLGEGERVGEAERRRLVTFREALRGLLSANNGVVGAEPGADARTLNGLAASAALRVRFRSGGHPTLEPGAGGGTAECVMARLLAEVVWAEAEGRWGRLKACR